MTNQKEIDRVCGMWIDTKEARFTTNYNGRTYYFCTQGCKEKFDQDPETHFKKFEGKPGDLF